MAIPTAEEVYEQHVKRLPPAERLRLMALTAQDLADEPPAPSEPRERSIMELHGLGRGIWDGIDAQAYVNELRKEWDHRP